MLNHLINLNKNLLRNLIDNKTMTNRNQGVTIIINNAFEEKQEWALHELYDLARTLQLNLDDFRLRKRVRTCLASLSKQGKIKRIRESTYLKI